ncbi:MAG: PAS domain S-box protein, partial [Chitinophagaceae bacterium]
EQGDHRTWEDFLVVGVGASAGGVEALREFFSNVDVSVPIAYVVILHLSPNHDSQLAEILQLVTRMPIKQVNNDVRLEPGYVYVVPPNRSLTIQQQTITVAPIESIEERRAPVDIFFRSLAESFGPRAIGVILSGTGANGSMGIKRLKENGGIILVQDPVEAQFDEMPRNTIETGLADAILHVAKIPSRIISYSKRIATPAVNQVLLKQDFEPSEHLRNIFLELRVRTGHDFSNYKKATILRRIERRMNVRNLSSLEDYALFIKNEPDEAPALLKDLLISVTNFFRDKEAFLFLEKEIIPAIIRGKTSAETVRVWVAGCATGEEAYSIAMLLSEQLAGNTDAPQVQIFATDIDNDAIAMARDGVYTINDAADVSPERLLQFFTREGDDYRICRELREMILFANHNLIKDPPFSHLDLATCRNLLIYLNHTAQKRVMDTLHFALTPGRYLFIGSSESIDGSSDLYLPVAKEFHIYQSRAVVSRPFPVPDKFPSHYPAEVSIENIHAPKKSASTRLTYNELHQRLLEQYAPPSIVVNQDFDIVHVSEKAGKYMQILGGEPSNNILKLIRPELRLELRSALYQATRQQKNLEVRNLKLKDTTELVDIHVRPVFKSDEIAQGFILVVIDDSKGKTGEDVIPGVTGPNPIAEHLEDELERSKVQLRSSVEQYEVQTEELKASNEELQAMNEELRSAAEELETSKEELQSINEELLTVNQELKVKIEELFQSNNNFHNLINSTDIGTIFLDRAFRVNLFTPTVRQIFNLINNDIGRPLSDISSKLKDQNVISDAALVMERLMTVEREVVTFDGEYFMMRLLPYRTAEDHINGVVITFVNISKLKESEQKVRHSAEQQGFLLRLGDEINKLQDPDLIIEKALQSIHPELKAARVAFGEFSENWKKTEVRQVFPVTHQADDDKQHIIKNLDEINISRLTARHEGPVLVNKDQGHPLLIIPLRSDGNLKAYFYLETTGDTPSSDTDLLFYREVGERCWTTIQKVKSERSVRRNEEHMNFVMESIADYAIITTDGSGKISGWNTGAENMFGYTSGEAMGENFAMIFTPEDRAAGIPLKEVETAMAVGRADDERWHLRKDNTRFYVSGVTNRLMHGMEGMVKIARDRTAEKLLEQQKDQFLGIASHELKTPVTSIKAYAEVLHDMFVQSNDTQSAELMTRLDSQVDRLTVLISHLLDTTRIAEGQLVFTPEEFDLNHVVEDRLQELQLLTKRHALVQKRGELQMVTGDRERIGQVLVNLVTNAIKYTPDGGNIVITTTDKTNGAEVAVSDTGIGMDPKSTGKIFERFDRTDNPKIQTYPGLGLGLYISAEIVRRHNGRIWVESQKGKGSTFYFFIPYQYNGF